MNVDTVIILKQVLSRIVLPRYKLFVDGEMQRIVKLLLSAGKGVEKKEKSHPSLNAL